MDRYQKGKIYQIVDNGYNMFYIGSTCCELSARLAQHRMHYKQFNKMQRTTRFTVYNIFDKYGAENCKIELIENFPCEHRAELLKREGFYTRSMECVNKQIPDRTREEYCATHKEEMKATRMKYIKENREKMKAMYARYYEEHKEDFLAKCKVRSEKKHA